MSVFTDPVEAALERIRCEQLEDQGFLGPINVYKRSIAAVIRGVFQVVSPTASKLDLVQLPSQVVEAWQDDSAARSHEQQIYLLDAIIEKMKSYEELVGGVHYSLDQKDNLGNRLADTVGDCLSAVRLTANRDKIDFFASIAVSGSLVYKSAPIEQTLEFIRITSQLTSTDILVLRELAKSQKDERQDVIRSQWSSFLLHLDTIVSSIFYRSAFVRLQALGLAERLQEGFGSPEAPYQALELGKLYVAYLADHHAAKS